MTYTVDANVLLYASDADSRFHPTAIAFIDRLVAGPELVYLFWPTAMAYLRISTHPAIFSRPLSSTEALSNVEALLARPHVQAAGEGDRFWSTFMAIAGDVPPTGNLVSDAQLVALMIEHGVTTIWTHDRDLRKFRGIVTRDPFG